MLFRDTTGKEGAIEANSRPPEKTFIPPTAANRDSVAASAAPSMTSAASAATPRPALKESVLSAELTIEGKIEGAGHVRIAGRFKGDIHVQGNVTIEQGAVVTGEVKADVVVIAGQLDGNVDATTRVELLSSGLLNGDLKAGSLTVAAGSRMRGRAEFGWSEKTN
jgi:cytoskeletal protein CcmA (bactofilin family)